MDVLRLAGVASGSFNIRVTDQLVNQTDSGDRITIVNNDGDLTTSNELAATIDLRAVSANKHVTFVGANADGVTTSAQTVILNDVTANGSNILNGGSNNMLSQYVVNGRDATGAPGATFATQADADAKYAVDVTVGVTGNNNVLQIFNNAEVTVGDLANTSNFSTIQFINDQASVQTLNLSLNNAVVDALVNANHTATADQRETLTITAQDNALVTGATATLNIQAGSLGSQFNLNVTGGAGADVIVAGAGNDTITGGAGADVMTGGLGADTFAYGTLATVSAQTGITLATADTITDFVSGTDFIKTGTAGTAANYAEAAAVADFTTALTAANTAMDTTVVYYLTSTAADGGLLFVDSNADGTADALIKLTGVDNTSFDFADIIA